MVGGIFASNFFPLYLVSQEGTFISIGGAHDPYQVFKVV